MIQQPRVAFSPVDSNVIRGPRVLHVEGLSHHYGLRPVLRDVSFDLAAGRTLAIIGPNGIGKSTLLGLIGGAMAPAGGAIEIDGLRRRGSVDDELAIRRRTVFLPGDPWLPGGVTGRGWLIAIGELYGIAATRLFEHVDGLLRVFHLVEIADSEMTGYSAGQKKKIALSSALVTEAPLLVLDEPFGGGLDPAGIAALARILVHLARERARTIVISAPVPEIVEEVADRVLILGDGRVLAEGTVAELRERAGGTATLAAALERLVFPETEAEVDDYLAGSAS